MHFARQFQNSWLGSHSFERRNSPILRPLLLRTWRIHLCSQLYCSWRIQLTRSLLNFSVLWAVKIGDNLCLLFLSTRLKLLFFGFRVHRISWPTHEWLERWIEGLHPWAKDAVWYVPCFSYSIVRPLSHSIVSCNLSHASSWFFEVKIARSDRNAVYLPSLFTDVLDARKQIQIKSPTKVHAISSGFSIAETTPCSVTVDGFIHASVQINAVL